MKLLMWLVLGWGAVMWFMHQKKARLAAARRAANANSNSNSNANPAGAQLAEAMLPCVTCGVHLPRSEALVSADGKQVWCCDAHRQQHLRQAAS